MPSVPRPAAKANRRARATIKFGSWLRLYTEDQLLAQLSQFGLSRRSFRTLLDALHVPTLHVGNLRFVDGFSFFVALRAVLSIGQPDFICPGSESSNKNRRPISSLSLDDLNARYRRVVADLLYAKRLMGLTLTDQEIRATAADALSRMQNNAYRLALSRVTLTHQQKADMLLRSVRAGETPP